MTHLTPRRRTSRIALSALLLITLAGCTPAQPAAAPSTPPSGADMAEADPSAAPAAGHGAVSGAAEVAEAQLHLVTLDTEGSIGLFDLLDGSESTLASVGTVHDAHSDGRYVFADTGSGVTVIDSGVWSWDHGDHFHYYRADPRLTGTIDGSGPATVAFGMNPTSGATGVFFGETGDAVLLDNAALSTGTITETLRLTLEPHAGMIVPLGAGALITHPGDDGVVRELVFIDESGKPGERIACANASGTITTRLGVVVGCSDGAVLATVGADENAVFTFVPYPAGVEAAPATEFHARKGRPTVVGVGSGQGFWVLDTRNVSWAWHDSDVPLLRVTGAGDDGDHVVAIAADGTVQVFSGLTGARLAVSDPVLSPADTREHGAHVSVSIDAQRAYVNSPSTGVVFEIDYKDSARIARVIEPATSAVLFEETGR